MKRVSLTQLTSSAYTYITEQLLYLARESFFNARVIGAPGMGRLMNFWDYFFKLSRIEFLRRRMPEFQPDKTAVSWIPINRTIEGAGEQVALPEAVLDHFIERASHRVIVNFCGCREALHCKDYPADIGCLMMGESALLIPERSRREVGVEEAKAHIRKAIAAGLIPVTGKVRLDNDIFMIPDRGKLLTVCLCCECCCITRFTRHIPVEIMDATHKPIQGLTIEVGDECIGCGDCSTVCYLDTIDIIDGKAIIGELCRACGRCASHCPNHAIKLKVDDSQAAIQEVIQRIEALVNYQ